MKNLTLSLFLLIQVSLFSQHFVSKKWYTLYSLKDTAMGIDLVNALNTTPAPADAKSVIVAVIDGGTDVMHEDLKANIWVNNAEIPGNSVDDDHNGYIDDINGWDFIGGAERDVNYDNLEMTRLLRMYMARFEGKTIKQIGKNEKADFKRYKEIESKHAKQLKEDSETFKFYSDFKVILDAVINEIGSDNFSLKELLAYSPDKNEAKLGKSRLVLICESSNISPKEFIDQFNEGYEHLNASVNYQLALSFDPRYIVGDNYLDATEKGYGNNEVKGPDAMHGTHVAGIIGADRTNGIGVNGIATMVQLMVLRVVPDGDERDKDVANAIRYAVDNGAKVINMSFGKAYSFNKKIVDDAVKYAESKDVLIIHAAGNDAQNTDKESNFPTPKYENGTYCTTWIEVGSSTMNQSPSDFSNYGKKTVNVFAPGSEIYNTAPDNQYKWLDGTSMASPVVAGVAALIRSYYPKLTAVQVKSVIENSVVKPVGKFIKPGSQKTILKFITISKKTKYKKLCTSKGIVNANNALKAASEIK